MTSSALAELHAPLLPILRHVLALALPAAGTALDLACGPGVKAPLLAEACGPATRLVGLDRDAGALRAARAAGAYAGCVAGDAAALPLRDGCCAAAFCIAALGLFDDRPAALRELRRVLRPGGTALVVVGTQAWAPLVRPPAPIAARLRDAYALTLAAGHPGVAPSGDLCGDLAAALIEAGFDAPHTRAFLLGVGADPIEAELPLLPWAGLRPLVAARLAPAELTACDRAAAEAEVELCTAALVARAGSPVGAGSGGVPAPRIPLRGRRA